METAKMLSGHRLAMTLAIAAVLLPVGLPPGAGQQKRAFGIADYYRVKFPAAPSLSPDGRHLAYHLTTYDLEKGTSNKDIYRVSVAGGRPQRLTTTDAIAETSPLWSPDQRHILFVADRGEGSQLWLLPTAGGEARALTHVPGGASSPVWSPSGRHVAFVSEVYPECGADARCHRGRDEARERIPLEVHVADELLYRHWDSWSDGRVRHVLLVDVKSGEVRDMTPGEREAPAYFQLSAVAFSPDGKELAYTRNPDPIESLAWSTNTDVWVVPVEPGPDGRIPSARNITDDNEGFDGHPSYSPDGKYIAYLSYATPRYEADLPRLFVYERETGARRELLRGFDDQIVQIRWAPDSRGLYFSAEVRGATPIYFVSVEGGAAERIVTHAHIDDFEISPGGGYAWTERRSFSQPPELWGIDLSGERPPRQVTHHNDRLAREVDIRPAESVTIEGAGGQPMQMWIIKPHDFDPNKRYPLILNIHGGPQYQWSDAFRGDWQVYPGAGYVLAMPNPHGSTGFGQDYTAAISGDYGGKVYQDILAAADYVAELDYVDGERLGVMGWSWGGYAVNWIIGHTDRFKAAASMMGIYDLASFWASTEELWYPEWDLGGLPWTSDDYEEFNPASAAEKMGEFRVPTLIITGEKDYRIPYTQSLQLFTVLRRQSVPARLIVFPDAGHWPGWYEMALYYTAHLEWFETYLGGGGAEWTVEEFAAGEAFRVRGVGT